MRQTVILIQGGRLRLRWPEPSHLYLRGNYMGDDTKQNKSSLLLVGLAVMAGSMLLCGGIGVALVLPAIQASREAARRQAIAQNLKQIGIALQSYNMPSSIAEVVDQRGVVAYQKLFDDLDTGAEVGTDPAFEKLAAERQFKANLVAPRHLRDLLVSWEGSGLHHVDLVYRFDDRRISMTWNASMRIPEEYDVARSILLKTHAMSVASLGSGTWF